jgi:hypothetical protein
MPSSPNSQPAPTVEKLATKATGLYHTIGASEALKNESDAGLPTAAPIQHMTSSSATWRLRIDNNKLVMGPGGGGAGVWVVTRWWVVGVGGLRARGDGGWGRGVGTGGGRVFVCAFVSVRVWGVGVERGRC